MRLFSSPLIASPSHSTPTFGALYSIELTRTGWQHPIPAGGAVRERTNQRERQQMREVLRSAMAQVTGQAIPADALYINRTLTPAAVVATSPLERYQLNTLFAKSALFDKTSSGMGGRIRRYLNWATQLFIQDRQPTPVIIDVNTGDIRVGGRRGQIRSHLTEAQRQLLDHTLTA